MRCRTISRVEKMEVSTGESQRHRIWRRRFTQAVPGRGFEGPQTHTWLTAAGELGVQASSVNSPNLARGCPSLAGFFCYADPIRTGTRSSCSTDRAAGVRGRFACGAGAISATLAGRCLKGSRRCSPERSAAHPAGLLRFLGIHKNVVASKGSK